MKIVSNLNGTTKTTTYGNKLYYREGTSANYTQVKRAFYRSSANGTYTQIYLYDETAPTITVTSSTANTVSASYTLTGTVVDTESGVATLKINNVDVTWNASSGAFSKTYTLSSGNNTFTIVSTDGAGNSATKSVTINYINQKNNTSYNWTKTQQYRNPSSGSHGTWYRQVKVNGTWHTYYIENEGSTDNTWVTKNSYCSNTIPIPKGVKTLSISTTGNGREGGAYGYGYLKDNTTGTTLKSESNTDTGATTLTYTFTEAQSTHNIVYTFSCSGHGYAYSDAHAYAGISSWSFTYFD